MGLLVFPELVVPLGTHPCKVWSPGPEWRPPGPPVSQRPSLAHDGTRGLGHVFKTCCSLSGSRALARSSACFQDPRVPCPFLPSRLRFGWRLPPRISFLPSLQASVILDARPPSLCPRNPVPNAGRRPPSPLARTARSSFSLGSAAPGPAPAGQRGGLPCGPSPFSVQGRPSGAGSLPRPRWEH